MRCTRCEKDLTHTAYKIKFHDEVLCLRCYQQIPYQERYAAARGEDDYVRQRNPKADRDA